MEWVNYHHLLYFWTVAREGSLARACAELRLSPSTVSKQVHQLEEALGHPLFVRSGRRLAITESGRVVFRYADTAGNATDEGNANGSLHNIAGIINEDGNVMGLMPHPERSVEALLGSTDGLPLFQSLAAHFSGAVAR